MIWNFWGPGGGGGYHGGGGGTCHLCPLQAPEDWPDHGPRSLGGALTPQFPVRGLRTTTRCTSVGRSMRPAVFCSLGHGPCSSRQFCAWADGLWTRSASAGAWGRAEGVGPKQTSERNRGDGAPRPSVRRAGYSEVRIVGYPLLLIVSLRRPRRPVFVLEEWSPGTSRAQYSWLWIWRRLREAGGLFPEHRQKQLLSVGEAVVWASAGGYQTVRGQTGS